MNLFENKDKSFAVLRIVFGLVWLADAYFKWLPAFREQFVTYITNALDGQPAPIQAWINFWVHIVGVNPQFFAYHVATTETIIAIGLIFGLFTRLVSYGGLLFAFVIWSTAEGFGGPYAPGSTDIGGAIIYILVFTALLIGQSWKEYSLDKKIQHPFL